MKILKEKYLNENNMEINIVCVGDGIDEKKALFKLCEEINDDNGYSNNNINNKGNENYNKQYILNKKFIQVIDNPSITSILLQLKFIQDNIIKILEGKFCLYKMELKMDIDQKIQIDCKAIPTKQDKKKFKKKKFYNENTNNNKINDIDYFDNYDYYDNDMAVKGFFEYEEEKFDENYESENIDNNNKKFFIKGGNRKIIKNNTKKENHFLGLKRGLQ